MKPRSSSRRGRALLVILGGVATFAAIAWWVFTKSLPAWNTPTTFVASIPHARSTTAPQPPIARRLVWVVVDGLTYDVAASTETILPLADAGVLRPMIAAFPTFTAGGITSMFTGQSPRESGVRLNGAAVGTLGLDDVLHACDASGASVRVHARDYPEFLALTRPPEAAHLSTGRLGPLIDATAWPLEPERREVIAIHFGEVDDRGHDAGWDSPAYREAALDAGVFLQHMAASLDVDRDVLIAVSDHGHRPDGGHGGVEPDVQRAFFLAWGAAIRRGATLAPRPLRDVASTVAVLVGAHTPSSNMGVPMLDILDVDASRRAALSLEPFDELVAYDCAQAPDLAACADAGRARDALLHGEDADAQRTLVSLTSNLDARRDADQTSAATTRAVFALLLGAAILIVAWRAKPRRAAAFALPLVTLGPYVALLLAMGYLPTLSKMTSTPVFAGDATWALALPLALVAFVAARHRIDVREVIWLEAVGLAIAVPLVVWAGADPRRTFDPIAGTLVFQLAPIPALTTASGAVILAVGAIRRHRERARVRPISS